MNSISDRYEYKKICSLASKTEEHFNTFKTNFEYNGILEHVTKEQGQLYIDYLKKNNPNFVLKLEDYKKNDLFGSPRLYFYKETSEISPTTLRYIKVLSDLKSLFGDLSGKKIIEIGVGYGGQCFIINKEFKNVDYSLVDLDEVLQLSSKYLNKLNVSHTLTKINNIGELDEEYDLVISNYSYSELNKNLQDLYYDKIIKKSKNGYFTLNFVSHLFGIESYNLNEIKDKFKEKNPRILEENPSTFENNKILYF